MHGVWFVMTGLYIMNCLCIYEVEVETDGQLASLSWYRVPDILLSDICGLHFWGALSLMRGRVCNLLVQFAVILQAKICRTHDYILLSPLRLQGSLFVASYDSQGYGRGTLTYLHTSWFWSVWRIYVTLTCSTSIGIVYPKRMHGKKYIWIWISIWNTIWIKF
jgi:hypothetical protein